MFRRRIPDCPPAVRESLGDLIMAAAPVGSRITCSPPPVDTDEDWLILVIDDPKPALDASGFTQDGSPEFYTGNDAGGFRSWRLGDLNVVTTQDGVFYDRFMTATHLAKQFNLLRKVDRIALFQAILYGVRADALEYAPPLVHPIPDELEIPTAVHP